jgi:hypothetical protein
MADITSLLQNVQQKIRRCPEPTLVHAYREAARDLCNQSRWLRRTIDVDMAAGDSEVSLLLDSEDAELEIVGVKSVRAFAPSQPTSTWPLRPDDETLWPPNQEAGQPYRYAYVPESMIALPAPTDAAYTLRVICQVTPADGVSILPDDLLLKWQRTLDAGALAYLYDLGGQPWSSERQARVQEVKFKAGINNAKADEQRGYNTGTVMARIRRLF